LSDDRGTSFGTSALEAAVLLQNTQGENHKQSETQFALISRLLLLANAEILSLTTSKAQHVCDEETKLEVMTTFLTLQK
jgi:hypothetical protein